MTPRSRRAQSKRAADRREGNDRRSKVRCDLTITPSGQSNGTSAIASVKPPESPFLITAGSVIPAVLISGINSELPGPILAQVRENVFDSASGRWVLIPQGSKILGSYQANAAYGQERAQIEWKRVIFPNSSSMDIPDMPGADQAGYAGFSDEVNNHYLKTFGTAALISVISAGQMVGQMGAFGGGTGFSALTGTATRRQTKCHCSVRWAARRQVSNSDKSRRAAFSAE